MQVTGRSKTEYPICQQVTVNVSPCF
jgi:hypothetical protein